MRAALETHVDVDCIYSERPTYCGRTVEVIWKFLRRSPRDHDLLVVGFFAQLLMPVLYPFWRGPVLADCYISLFDSYVNDKAMASAKSIRGRLCYWLDLFLLRHADVVFTDTQEHAKYLREKYLAEACRIKAIPISADEVLFPKLAPANRQSSDDCFIVLFFGAFIPLQGVETIIRAAYRLNSEKFKIRLIGKGQTYDSCAELARSLGVKNLQFEGWKEVEEISKEAQCAHLILGIFGQTEKARRVIPNKVFEALSMGRPLVTGDSIAMREFFTDGENVFLVPFDDPAALADKIEWLSNDYGQALRVAEAGHETFLKHLSPRSVAERVGEILKGIG